MISFTPQKPPQSLLTQSLQFRDDRLTLFRSKSWRRWPKVVSKKIYERLVASAREFLTECLHPSERIDAFIVRVLDRYIEKGCLEPDFELYSFELALFSMLRRQIDDSLSRRAKAVIRAEKRRAEKLATTPVEHRRNPHPSPDSDAYSQYPRVESQPQSVITPSYLEYLRRRFNGHYYDPQVAPRGYPDL